jgi:hypothetical protein
VPATLQAANVIGEASCLSLVRFGSGFMEGAALSGVDAARQILKDFKNA